MFVVETIDGRRLSEDDCYWHDLPTDIVIARMGAKFTLVDHAAGVSMDVANDFISGFDAYGFQKYDIVSTDENAPRSHGVQLIAVCLRADAFMVFDINLSTGERQIVWRPLSELTYKQELLRTGLRG